MSKPFDMELLLAGVLTGSHNTRQLHQAKIIQAAISERWQQDNSWTWHRKHLIWFINHRISQRAEAIGYYYRLTAQLMSKRLGNTWFR